MSFYLISSFGTNAEFVFEKYARYLSYGGSPMVEMMRRKLLLILNYKTVTFCKKIVILLLR